MNEDSKKQWSETGAEWARGGVHPADRKRVDNFLQQNLKLKPSDIVLDLASGDKSYIADQQAKIVHTDISQKLLKLNPSKQEKVVNDSLELCFSSNSFDVALNTFMMRYLSQADQINAIKEMIRVTKPSGIIIIIDFYKAKYKEGEVASFDAALIQEKINTIMEKNETIQGKTVSCTVQLLKDEKEGTGKGTGTPSNMFALLLEVN